MKTLPHLPVLSATLRVLRWHRRTIAALCAFVGVFVGLNALQPAEAATVTVVVAAHDLPGGATLTASNLAELRLPADVVPGGAGESRDAWVGRTLNAPVTQRSVITVANVTDSPSLVGAGMVAAAVPVSDPALLPAIKLGGHVDVWGGHPATALVKQARVVALPASAQGAGPLGGGSSGSILIEVDPAAAAKIAAAGEGSVRLTVR